MLDRHDWLAQAQRLDVGRSKRIGCNCGPGHVLKISRDEGGFLAYCFREGEHDRAAPPHESLAERVERLQRTARRDTELRQSVGLPPGLVADIDGWPPAAYLWLLKAGFSRQDIGGLGARFDPASNRLVLPVVARETGDVVFWQARSIDGRQPKYLAPAIDRSRVIYQHGHADAITLTEDILSAHKIGLSGGEGWSMLGTKLSDHVLSELMKAGKPVNVWLDNDLPPLHAYNKGQIAATKVLARLRAAGLTAHNIVSTLDPKLMPRSDIKEKIHVLLDRQENPR